MTSSSTLGVPLQVEMVGEKTMSTFRHPCLYSSIQSPREKPMVSKRLVFLARGSLRWLLPTMTGKPASSISRICVRGST